MGPYGLVEFGFEAVESTIFREANPVAGFKQHFDGLCIWHPHVERQASMQGRPTS